jgi:hypothetical protein
MKSIAPKVLLFMCFLCSHYMNAEDWREYISWEKTAPALVAAGVLTAVGYCFYSLMAQYLGKHIARHGSRIGGFVSSVACTGFVVTALTGKNVFYPQRTDTTISGSTVPLSRRIGCGIGGLALLWLSWRYWESCRPGIEFYHTGLVLPLFTFSFTGVVVATALKPWYGTDQEKNEPTIKHVSIAVAYAVGVIAAGIISWKYYWQPTIYGA